MSKPSTDREIIQAIGVSALISHGYTEHVVRKWMQRCIPWHARAKVQRVAKEKRIPIPSDFLEKQREVA